MDQHIEDRQETGKGFHRRGKRVEAMDQEVGGGRKIGKTLRKKGKRVRRPGFRAKRTREAVAVAERTEANQRFNRSRPHRFHRTTNPKKIRRALRNQGRKPTARREPK